MTKRQFIVAISVVLVIAIAIGLAVFHFLGKPPAENDVAGTRKLTTGERADIRLLSSSFLQDSTNFGVNLDSLSESTVSQRMEDIANDNGGTSWTKRTSVASQAVSQYVDLSGGFPYNSDRIANGDFTDGNNTASFRSGPMTVEPSAEGSYVYTNRNEPILTAKVSFSGYSTLAHFAQSTKGLNEERIENDDEKFTPWDISEQTVALRGTLTVSQEKAGDDWRIRDIHFSEGEFATPFWEPSANTTAYPGITLGGKVVRTIKFPSGEENTDVPQ